MVLVSIVNFHFMAALHTVFFTLYNKGTPPFKTVSHCTVISQELGTVSRYQVNF